MFDTNGRLVVSNDQYITMYGLSPDVVKPGAALIDIIRSRISSGNLRRDPQEYCNEIMSQMAAGKTVSFISETPDGRAVSVVNRPIPGSNYWVGTHDDITERRAAERRSALLDEQEARRALIEEAIVWFRQSVEGVLKTVADSVAAMQSTASVLAATSNECTSQTAGAVQTSSDAFSSAQIAATAADELSKSIAEINRQLVSATEVVGAAATEAQSTNTDIAELAQAAPKIDDVVKLIQSVARQTNLLALERHHRGGARRCRRQGLCRRCLGSQNACGADGEGDRRHRVADRRGAGLDAQRRRRDRHHRRPHAGNQANSPPLSPRRSNSRIRRRRRSREVLQPPRGRNEIGGLGVGPRLRVDRGHAQFRRHRYWRRRKPSRGPPTPARQRRRLPPQGRDLTQHPLVPRRRGAQRC